MGAVESPIAESVHWFVGEDRTLLYDVTSDGTAAQTMTGWALTWELLDKRASAGGTVLLTKTTGAGTITIGNGAGTDDRATVTIADVDTESGTLPNGPGTYFTVLRRTDAGSEVTLAFGDAVIQRASI